MFHMAHHNVNHIPQWPQSTHVASPSIQFSAPDNLWSMTPIDSYSEDASSSSPLRYEHNLASSPEDRSICYPTKSIPTQSHPESLQDMTWQSINSRSSFSSSSDDYGYNEQEGVDSTIQIEEGHVKAPARRRRRTMDPKQRHTEKLEKNRKAAERCRQKQRLYVSNLQERARKEEIKRAHLIMQVSQLRDDILSLKESMVSHSGCDDERIKQYLLTELAKTSLRRSSSSYDSSNSTASVEQQMPLPELSPRQSS